MNLASFQQRHLRRLERRAAAKPPAPATCLNVVSVAPRSLAASAGLAPGDLVTSVNGKAPTADAGSVRLEDRAWRFFRPRAGEVLELDASGIDLGLVVRPTPERVMADLERAVTEPLELLALWEARRWEELKRASRWVLGRHAGFFQKLMGNLRFNAPPWLLYGAALYELGRRDEGLAIVHDWDDTYAEFWTQDWSGITCHYLALEAEARGDGARARELREAATRHHPTSARLAEQAGTLPGPEYPWLGKPFPTDVPLVHLDTQAPASLKSSLRALGERQFLVVCSLASYRGNGPYNDFMKQLPAFVRHFEPYWGGLVVVTSEPERREDRPWHFVAEDQARAAKVPFELLLEDGELTDVLDPSGSPHFYLLSRDGTVLGEGEHGGVDVWSAVAHLG